MKNVGVKLILRRLVIDYDDSNDDDDDDYDNHRFAKMKLNTDTVISSSL